MNVQAKSSALKRALFVFSIMHYYREMFPVAEYFRDQGFAVHVVIGWAGDDAGAAAHHCESTGFVLQSLATMLKYDYVPPDDQGGGLLSKLKRRYTALFSIWEARRSAAQLISMIEPDVVFSGHFHSCGQFDNGIARACHKRSILFCGLPFSIYLGERQATTARFNNIRAGMIPSGMLDADTTWFRRLLAAAFPHWTRERDGQRIFMHPPQHMLASWLFGLIDQNPWQKPSELFDIVFVEGEFSRHMLAESNYDLSKVVVSGKPLLDDVLRNLSNETYLVELYHDLGLPRDAPFILCNVEPSAEHHYSSWEDHWARFNDVMAALKETGQPVVLSLHPLCNPDDYRFAEEEYGFRISEKYKIGALYPYCNLVVSFPCSTNALSAIFERKLIIYDFFGMTQDDYPAHGLYRFPGASYAHDGEELRGHLQAFVNSPDYHQARTTHPSSRPLAGEVIYAQVMARLKR